MIIYRDNLSPEYLKLPTSVYSTYQCLLHLLSCYSKNSTFLLRICTYSYQEEFVLVREGEGGVTTTTAKTKTTTTTKSVGVE